MRPLSRRNFLAAASAVAAAPLLPARLFAATPDNTPVHGLSAFGELKYPVDFKHFDYINPDAPKGGRMNFAPPNWAFNQSVLTFNTLNTFVFKGQAPVRAEMCFDTLMLRALDEPDAIYGLLAESVSISADRNTFTFKLRPEARWHDGAPLTAEDVAFTYKIFRDKDRAHPALWDALKDVVEAVAVDDHTVRIVFDGKQGEQAVLSAATMPIVSKAYYEANDFGASTMKPPLGSGPYRMGRISAGSSIEYERVADYWAQDLPVNRGQNNFDLIRIEFFADRDVAFEAFKKGDIHFRQEFTSRTWATAYHFPAIKEGRVIKREFPRELAPQMQAIGLNQRRPQFQDVRVRRAIAMCFDFEWMKKNLFFNSYDRSQSSFEQSDFKATGLPSPEELALLEPFRAELPPEAFGEAV
ncbi:ABC transporter substrate-binding protein, partial [Salmonella enterica subsp. enterica]|nr:ABC transporter substrate-binding protein [Salmonella enterica subsp. enterica serovar Enteritidis]